MPLQALKQIAANPETVFTLYALRITDTRIIATRVLFSIDDELKAFSLGCINFLVDKEYQQKEFKPYPFGAPKDHIESIVITDQSISPRYQELLQAIANPETNNTDIKNYGAYVIVATLGETKTLLINMKKPLKNYKNYWYQPGNEYKKLDKPLLNLVYHFDCIITSNNCYFITLNAESIFKLQQYHKRKAQECKDLLIARNLVNTTDLERIDGFLKKPGHFRAMCNYDSEKIEAFSQVTLDNKISIEERYRLSFMDNGNGTYRVDLSGENSVKAFIDTITFKRGKDFEDNTVESATPFKRI